MKVRRLFDFFKRIFSKPKPPERPLTKCELWAMEQMLKDGKHACHFQKFMNRTEHEVDGEWMRFRIPSDGAKK